jgi:hypothetical protein
MMKDYYAILHVLPSAEIDVIKAAYKALARKYHPDTFDGDKAYASKRMQEINDAFGVIGDPDIRKKYDAERKAANSQNDYDEDGEDVDAKTEADWVLACKYCPDAVTHFEQLHKLSRSLAFAYKSYLLDTKKFSICTQVGKQMEDAFLRTYFGDNREMQVFAKGLILVREKHAAFQVNRAVKVMGRSLVANSIRRQVYAEYPKCEPKLYYFDVKYGTYSSDIGERLLSLLDIHFKISKSFLSSPKYIIDYKGEISSIPYNDLKRWIINNLSDLPDFGHI